jgi:hypothetical protein
MPPASTKAPASVTPQRTNHPQALILLLNVVAQWQKRQVVIFFLNRVAQMQRGAL